MLAYRGMHSSYLQYRIKKAQKQSYSYILFMVYYISKRFYLYTYLLFRITDKTDEIIHSFFIKELISFFSRLKKRKHLLPLRDFA